MGAARRWAYSKFVQFSKRNDNRLIPSYLQFDANLCNMNRHKNTFAVLPGSDASLKELIIIEAHLDSRCSGLCDTACLAQGIDDNGSGTALVLELARVMSMYTFDRTIVFLLTTAEEQSLSGATVFANYLYAKKINVKAVLNNDIGGGILCGESSSPPSCDEEGSVDSLNVRLFSDDPLESASKNLARYVKLQYEEEIKPKAKVQMGILLMKPEDRIGRGGDHIPFRKRGNPSIRFTSSHEHGDASNGPEYNDHQHTSEDILGVDTDTDGKIDSFFVDFNYLARNTVINGNAAAMAAMSPATPAFTLMHKGYEIKINIQGATTGYKVAIRKDSAIDWDMTHTFLSGEEGVIQTPPAGKYFLSVAAVDDEGIESFFSEEQEVITTIDNTIPLKGLTLKISPNPFTHSTMIGITAPPELANKTGYFVISDVTGKELERLSLRLETGENILTYNTQYTASRILFYTFMIEGQALEKGKMFLFSDN